MCTKHFNSMNTLLRKKKQDLRIIQNYQNNMLSRSLSYAKIVQGEKQNVKFT